VQLKQSLAGAVSLLTENQVPSPRMNAELLLMFTLNCDRAYLYAHPERQLSQDEIARYDAALADRSRGVPAQYITGHQEFWGMDLIVTPAVLIPRPETEHVIEAVLQILGVEPRSSSLKAERSGSSSSDRASLDQSTFHTAKVQSLRSEVHSPGSALRIVDVGTGSGCIALALAGELPEAEIHATDISGAALEVARANAARHQLEGRVVFHQMDLLRGLHSAYDFVVSNPPYVGESEVDQVQLEVRKFEPQGAVFAGHTGMEVIARLIPEAGAVLRPGGWLIVEISGTIADETKQLLKGWDEVRLIRDLQSIPRVAVARKTNY
jgi:release factor glutamine methyltransferase